MGFLSVSLIFPSTQAPHTRNPSEFNTKTNSLFTSQLRCYLQIYVSLWQYTAGKFVSQPSSVSPLKIDQIIALFVFQTQLKLIPYLKNSDKSHLSSLLKLWF